MGAFVGSYDDEGIATLTAVLMSNDCEPSSIHILDSTLSAEGLGKICEVLQTNEMLHWFGMTNVVLPEDVGASRMMGRALSMRTANIDFQLMNMNLGQAEAASLADGIMDSKAVRHLSLCNVSMGDHGAEKFAALLMTSTAIRTFCLMDSSMTPSSIAKVGNALAFGNNKVTAVGLDAHSSYAELLSHGKSIESLTIYLRDGCASVDKDGFIVMMDALHGNTTVRTLSLVVLSKCLPSMTALAELLRANRAIESVHIISSQGVTDKCLFDDSGLEVIAFSVRDHPRPRGLIFFHLDHSEDKQELLGNLGAFAAQLGIVQEAETWSDQEILDHLHALNVAKMDAFMLGLHARVGEHSPVRVLDDSTDCVDLLRRAYWEWLD